MRTKAKAACRSILGASVYDAMEPRFPLPAIMETAAKEAFLEGLVGPDVDDLRAALRVLNQTGVLMDPEPL